MVSTLLVHNLVDLAVCLAILFVAVAALHIAERITSRFISQRMGWNAVLITGWIGVPLHELSHLLMARLFGHRIVAWRLFDPDPATGTLGYVWHAYRRRNLWQVSGNFFIGIAPLLSGAGMLLLFIIWMAPASQYWLLPTTSVINMSPGSADWTSASVWVGMVHGLAESLYIWIAAIWQARTYWLPVQVYLCICVASHIAPSPRDLASAFTGLVVFFLFAIILVLVFSVAGRTTTHASLIAPILSLIVIVVALFQCLYVTSIAALSSLSSWSRN